jgi:hypothetical protein
VNNKEEVEAIIDLVDDDHSGQIEFAEFLSILKGSDGSAGTKVIKEFFEDLTNQKFGGEDIAFSNLVLHLRRRTLLKAIMERDEKAVRIMENVKCQVEQEKAQRKLEEAEEEE